MKDFKNKPGPKRYPYGTWKCKWCGYIAETKNQLSKHRACHPNSVKHHSSTPESVKKARATLKLRIADGLYIPKGHPHTKESKEKLSLARTKQIEERGGFQDVKWYKVRNLSGQEYTVRGHWEENVANALNKLGYNWVKNTWLEYRDEDGIIRHYNPDFYLVDSGTYVEVKGYYSDYDKIKMKLILQQHIGITIFFLHGSDYHAFINGKIQLDDSVKMSLTEAKFW